MSKYTTIQGDMWDSIAYKVYGNELFMDKLLQANQAYNDIAVFPSGVVLDCPDPETVGTIVPVPWRV
nr:tail protein X [Mitsuokella multacida]